MSEQEQNRTGALLERLGARFELVVETVAGFGDRLEALRQEMRSQFTEVGRQIRFLSDQIAENRTGVQSLRADLGAEMVRLGEMLGATRVETREQLENLDASLRNEIVVRSAQTRDSVRDEIGRRSEEARARLGEEIAAARANLDREIAGATSELKDGLAGSAETVTRKLSAELKHTNRALANLVRKVERFDDRVAIQTKDHEQRLKKLERRATRA